jgi:class 3 adenylate cyclase
VHPTDPHPPRPAAAPGAAPQPERDARPEPGPAPATPQPAPDGGLDTRLKRALQGLQTAVRRALTRSAETAEPFMVTAGLLGLCGQPLFYLIWRFVYPQPYENLTVRLVGAALCLPAIFKERWPERLQPWRPLYWVLGVFYNIPLLFSFFLLANGISQVWLLSMIGGMFVLTFLVDLATAIALFVGGAVLAYGALGLLMAHGAAHAAALRHAYLENLVIVLFPLLFGGLVNYQLQRYRTLQRNFERRLRNLTTQHSKIVQEQNNLLSRFLSNVIVARLRDFQTRYGLDEAIALITRQEKRFCGVMQADVRNFTKMFGQESEIEVAQLIRRCFTEITEVGQDLAVIKPVGDSIFVYTDDEQGRQNAVFNILSLAIFFVHSLEKINRVLAGSQQRALNFGIGVHAGEVIYGNLASDTLIDPTIIGINVNKTARLEELTKAPAVRETVGPNAIIFSDEIAFYGSNFIKPEHLITLELKPRGLALRDFPLVERVYALRSEVAVTYLPRAMEQIRTQRGLFSVGASNMEVSSYHGMSYYYEMQGMGPDTTWLALIDVSAVPTRTVSQFVLRDLPDLECEINQTDGRWLIVSTRNAPGEFDETDLESRIFRIIDGLQRAVGATHN